MNITHSTGHHELDDILKKNKIIDQEEQQNQKFKKLIEDAQKEDERKKKNWLPNNFDTHRFPKFPKNFHSDECLIQKAVQREIDAGVPEWRRTRAWFISCPCKRCNPFYL